jgi:hypothetical protein
VDSPRRITGKQTAIPISRTCTRCGRYAERHFAHSSFNGWRSTNLRILKTIPPSKKLRYIWNYLQWRSTSHPSDELTCLSILTGKQPSKVIDLPEAEGMKAFLVQMDGIPSDIIFMPGPRLPEDGWKWAPTSFMARYQWTAFEKFQESILPGAMIKDQTYISQRCESAFLESRS